jgi:hypothetical protein
MNPDHLNPTPDRPSETDKHNSELMAAEGKPILALYNAPHFGGDRYHQRVTHEEERNADRIH